MNFTAETSSNGVLERGFTVGGVPGVLWTPVSGPGPLVLLGHGGGQSARFPGTVGRAQRLVRDGFVVAAVDAPGHGGRPLTEVDERERALLHAAMAAGEPSGEIIERYNADVAHRAVPEWRAVLDALVAEPGLDGPVGYYGIGLGTSIGVPFVAAEPRISAAVFGLFWPGSLAAAAGRITVPVELVQQWDDEHIDRASALALFDAFGSKEKTLHLNAGGHADLPRFEFESAVAFFRRHLG